MDNSKNNFSFVNEAVTKQDITTNIVSLTKTAGISHRGQAVTAHAH